MDQDRKKEKTKMFQNSMKINTEHTQTYGHKENGAKREVHSTKCHGSEGWGEFSCYQLNSIPKNSRTKSNKCTEEEWMSSSNHTEG